MTEFSRIIIDARHRRAAYAMASLERLHAIVARSVDPERAGASRVLWRLDAGRNGSPSRMYIVASVTPDKQVLFEELGVPSSSIATCSYEPFLERLETGQEWGFRFKANPTHSEPSGQHGQRGRREGILSIEDQQEWLFKQARRAGFHMPINRLEMPEVVVRESRKIRFNRRGSSVTLASATFDGVLVVDDPDLLRHALVEGIGRAKGYGFGLMTLVPLADNRRGEAGM